MRYLVFFDLVFAVDTVFFDLLFVDFFPGEPFFFFEVSVCFHWAAFAFGSFLPSFPLPSFFSFFSFSASRSFFHLALTFFGMNWQECMLARTRGVACDFAFCCVVNRRVQPLLSYLHATAGGRKQRVSALLGSQHQILGLEAAYRGARTRAGKSTGDGSRRPYASSTTLDTSLCSSSSVPGPPPPLPLPPRPCGSPFQSGSRNAARKETLCQASTEPTGL